MTSINKIEKTDGTWLFLAPIRGLRLRKAVNYEFTVNQATFVDASKIAHRRKRLGFICPISEIKKKYYKGIIDRFFDEENCANESIDR